MDVFLCEIESPLGGVRVASTESGLCALVFADRWFRVEPVLDRRFRGARMVEAADPHGAVEALEKYFGGEIAAVDDLPVDAGGTEFQRRVWEALRHVGAGTTCSYGTLAERIGAPTASRAVGAANGQNPVSIVVPCHRVIGSGGALTGYAGGVERKRWLLAHEGALAASAAQKTPSLFET